MEERNKKQYKLACEEFLTSLKLEKLRPLGRLIGVPRPTKKDKKELLEQIVGVLAGEVTPCEISKRGAPVKNDELDPSIMETLNTFREMYLGEAAEAAAARNVEVAPTQKPFDFAKARTEMLQNPTVFTFNDPILDGWTKLNGIFRGQVHALNEQSCLVPLTGENSEKVPFLPVELIREHDLREGDVVSYRASEKGALLMVTEILTVHDLVVERGESIRRASFDECAAVYPKENLSLFDAGKSETTEAKYLQWLLPLSKGQRACIVSAPKAGKTELLYQTAKAALSVKNNRLQVIVLLVGQPPEAVGKFREIVGKENLLCTTYEDDPERQIFVAGLALNRAKRYAESGLDVLLLVDSLSALAHAYNDTDESAGGKTLDGGMESKTLRYLKKYFGTARRLEGSGTLTILGTASVDTGNPADELIAAQLRELCGAEIKLSAKLAIRRVFPAIDLQDSNVQFYENEQAARLASYVRSEYLLKQDEEKLIGILAQSGSIQEFTENILKA